VPEFCLAVQDYQAAAPRKASSPATVTLQLAQTSVPIAAPPPQRPLQQLPLRQEAALQPQLQVPPVEQAAPEWVRQTPLQAAASAARAAAQPDSGAAAPPPPQGQQSFMEQLVLADQGVDAPIAAATYPAAQPQSAAEQPRNEGLSQHSDAPGAQMPELAVQQQHHL
jgi:hypothetical protein